ncbi:uncharacterized protein [Watersipora subatra]|uniref:uncharacterized protein n=1 Tax=Watersipora subatra TaxID=2589382 RepID=UPI00355C883D
MEAEGNMTLTDNDVLGLTNETEEDTRYPSAHPQSSLPAYEESTSSPPPYTPSERHASTCRCHHKSEDIRETSSNCRQRFMWAIIHTTYIGITLAVLSMIVSVTAKLASSQGDRNSWDKYYNLSVTLSIISSLLTIPGLILFYILFFTRRLHISQGRLSRSATGGSQL